MKKVNTMRAQLLNTFVYEIEMSDMIRQMLANTPTCISVWKCNGCANSLTQKHWFIHLKHIASDSKEFNENIATTLSTMAKGQKTCDKCNEMMIQSDLNFNKILFFMFKEAKALKLSEIPGVVKSKEENVLFGAILYFILCLRVTGHYVTAIKVNENWSIFDDKKIQPHFVSQKKVIVVHALIYTAKENTAASVAKNLLREPIGANTSDILQKATNHSKKRNRPQSDKENAAIKRKKDNAISKFPKSTLCNIPTLSSSSLSKSNQEIINKIVILTNSGGGFQNTCAFDSVVQVNVYTK